METYRPTPVPLTDAPAANGPNRTGPNRTGVTMIGLALIMMLSVLDQTIVATALPSIAADLHGLSDLSWVVNAYLLGLGLAAPMYGKLGDMYGRKPLILIAVAVFVIASMACGAAGSMSELIAFRAVQGVGAGGLMNLTTAAVADLVPPSERGRVQGYTGAVFALGSIGGPLLGGLLTSTVGWRWVFYINVPAALVGMAIVIRYFNVPHRRTRQPLDWIGALLMAAAVTGVLLVTDWGGQKYGWTSPVILALALGAAVAIGLFLWREPHAANPILPATLWRSAVFRVAMPSSFLLGAGLFGTVVFLPQYFQVVRGASATMSGALLAPTMVAAVIAGVYSAVKASATGRYRRYPIAGAVLLIVGFVALTPLGPSTALWLVLGGAVVLGFGVGLQMQLMILIVQNAVPAADVGVATAAMLLFRSIGGAVGTALFSTLLLRRFSHELGPVLHGAAAGQSAGSLYGRLVLGLGATLGPARGAVVHAFGSAVSIVYVWAVPFGFVLLALAVLLPSVPLRRDTGGAEGTDAPETAAASAEDAAAAESVSAVPSA
jgi:EmrB/QacA subfamily drug resistance transporter